MTDFNTEQSVLISDTLNRLNQNGVELVVPRGYRDLPDSIPGSDIDIVVHRDRFKQSVEVLEESGFSRAGSPSSRLLSLLYDALEDPSRAKELILTNQRRLYLLLKNALLEPTHDSEVAAEYAEFKAEKGSVVFHLMDRLAYKSPHNQQKIPVDSRVEELLHERSESRGNFQVPSPPDEFAHLVCRGVFDYEGTFPPYYIKRCKSLSDVVFNSEEYEMQFRELMGLLFFDADEKVIECIEDERYDSIKSELLAYADY